VDFGTYTNNRYFNPYNELSIKVINFVEGAPRRYTLERWQADKNEDAGSTRSPLRLTGFATTQELSGNLVQNGDFANNVNGWTGWPNNAQVSRVTNHLDNGALKAYLPDNSVYPNFTLHNPDLFPMENNAWYRVRCSLESNAHGNLTIGIKGESTFNNPYTTWEQTVPFSNERRDLEMYFQSDLTDQAQIQFINDWTFPMYFLDNVEVTKVAVQPIDPNDRNRIFVNDQGTAQDFDLPDGCWGDVQGNILNGPISVPAYSSTIIYQLPDGSCDITTGVQQEMTSTAAGFHPNPVERGATIHFAPATNGRFILTDLRGSLVLDVPVPNGATTLAMPTEVAPGIYLARITGDEHTGVQQLVIR
jgi:hypothetical protein